MKLIGIDPGKSGGIGVITPNGSYAHKAPVTLADLWELMRDEAKNHECFAVIERVHSSPQQGVVSAFTFGQGYGALEMALTAAGIPFERVTPQTWQREMKCLTKGNKNVSKARAQELFPHLKITHHVADALLIAEYARRTRK